MKLITAKIDGEFIGAEHHRIHDALDRLVNEEYEYSFGLIYGRELIYSALPRNLRNLKQKILSVIKEVKWQ